MSRAHFKTEPQPREATMALVDPTQQITDATEETDQELSSQRFTFKQRVALLLISAIGSLIVRLIGCTLRPSISYEAGSAGQASAAACIYRFWHPRIAPPTSLFRDLDTRA